MPDISKLGTGFYVVRAGGRWYDVGLVNGKIALAAAHDDEPINWGLLQAGYGDWRNASPFPEFGITNEAPKKADKQPVRLSRPSSDPDMQSKIDEAIELCEAIERDAADIPSNGEEFASSVIDKAGDIRASIEEKGFATDKQITALENMHAGVLRWIER